MLHYLFMTPSRIEPASPDHLVRQSRPVSTSGFATSKFGCKSAETILALKVYEAAQKNRTQKTLICSLTEDIRPIATSPFLPLSNARSHPLCQLKEYTEIQARFSYSTHISSRPQTHPVHPLHLQLRPQHRPPARQGPQSPASHYRLPRLIYTIDGAPNVSESGHAINHCSLPL